MFFHNLFLPKRVWTHCIPYAFQFQVIFKIRFFIIDIASYTSLRLHKRFFRFSSPPVSKYFDENLAVTSSFQLSYIFQLYGFRQHCKHKLFSYDDSRCCLVLYIFAILYFFPDILSQEFDSMIYKSFSGVENVIPILFT